MKTIEVEFLADCANDRRGEKKAIDAKRAQKLLRTGYVRFVEVEQAVAVAPGAEEATAVRVRPRERGTRTDSRG